ncbi:MAG: hypothetical protein P8Y28_14175 [Gammaproteobacteria bacterium]
MKLDDNLVCSFFANPEVFGSRIVNDSRFGKPIGSHLGKPIYESVVQSGKKYTFNRLASCDRDGCPLDQLNKDELLFTPGLIYKQS